MNKKKLFDRGEDHQHFGLRKLTIGVASVLLGTTFMIYGGQTVHADTTAPSTEAKSEQVENKAQTNASQEEKSSQNNEQQVDQKTTPVVKERASQVSAPATQKADLNAGKQENEKNNAASVKSDEQVPTKAAAALEKAKQPATVSQPTKPAQPTQVSQASQATTVANKSGETTLPINKNEKPLTGKEVAQSAPQASDNLVNHGVDPSKVAALKALALKAMGMDTDLTDAQLAQLGLDRDTFLHNGIKYRVKADIAVHLFEDNSKYFTWDQDPRHDANGDAHDSAIDIGEENDNTAAAMEAGIGEIDFNQLWSPYLNGGTIYIHQGHALNDDDALRTVANSQFASTFTSVNWDSKIANQVNINKPGTYSAAVDVMYKNNLGVSAGVKVVVIGPTAQDPVYTDIGQEPNASKGIANNDEIQKYFAGTTYAWKGTPDVSKPGTIPATVVVTWPDQTTTDVDTHIIIRDSKVKVTGTEDVTRDIYTQLEDQTPTKVTTQKVTLTRSGEKDIGTGEVTWGAWSTGTIQAYAAPEITNYTVTNPDAGAAVNVDGSQTKLPNVVFHYTAKHQTITNGEGTTENVSRGIYTKLGDQAATQYTTQNITLHRTGDKNLATGVTTWGAWTPAQMPAYTAPTIANWTVINPDAGAAVTADGSQTKLADVVFDYKANTEKVTKGTGTTENVSRDIYVQIGSGEKQFDHTETTTLHRTGTRNLATGVITWDAWQPGTLAAVAAPVEAGYTVTNPDAGAAVTVDGSQTKVADVVFNYKANALDQVINYQYIVDGSVVKTDHVAGTAYQTVSYTPAAPTGYEIISGQSLPTSIHFDTTAGSPITIWVDHAKENVTDGTTKTITRTVNYINPSDGSTKLVTNQATTLHRTATKDMVTGQITYGNWDTGSFASVQAPTIEGYTVTNPNAASVEIVNSSTPNSTVTFKYAPTLHNQTINYVDNSDKTTIVNSDNVTGLTGATVQYNAQSHVPYGWEIVAGQNVPTTITFGTKDGNPISIYIEHAHQNVTDGTTENVSRNIYTNVEGQGRSYVDSQTITLHRTGTMDMVTYQVTYGAWTPAQMPAYTAPTITNYTVTNPDAGAAVTADGSTTQLPDVVFNYTANHKKITEGEGTTKDVSRDIYTKLGDQDATKYATQNVTLHRVGDENLATGQITWGAWTPAQMPAYAAPTIANWTVTNPDAGAAVTADGSLSKLADVVFNYTANTTKITTGEGTTEQVSRDIYTNVEGQGQQKVGTETVTLNRTGTKNNATGVITWDAWQPGTLKAVTAPSVPGYTVTNPDAGAAVTVDGSQTKVADVIFNYTANNHSTSVNYTNNGNTIYTYTVSGKTGQTVDTNITTNVPTGWEIVPGTTVPSTITYGTSGNDQPINVPIEHKVDTITTGDGTVKTVTRTIDTQIEGQAAQTAGQQTATIHRVGHYDEVTKQTTWDAWQTANLPAYPAPTIPGYTVTNGNAAPAIVVNGDSQNSTVTFHYVAADHSTVINYTNNGNTIYHYSISGKTGQEVQTNISSNVPTGWEIVPGTQYPTVIRYGSQDNIPTVNVPIEHKVDVITTGDGTSKTVTRTVETQVGDQPVQTIAQQTATIHRVGHHDEVTGVTTWDAWQTTSLPAVAAPNVPGYTVTNPDAAPEITINGDSQNSTVVFTYTANDHQQVINYVDHTSGSVVKTYNVAGKTGQTVDTNIANNIPTGWVIVPNTSYPTTVTFGTGDTTPINVQIEHGTKTITGTKDNVKTVTRTIQYQLDSGSVQPYTVQNVTLQRTGTQDLVTGQITWGAWSTGSFQAVTAPTVPGYTVTNPDAAPQVAVNGDSQNSTVVFHFTANNLSSHVIYVDQQKGTTVKTDTVNGKANTTVNYTVSVPAGYKLANGQPTSLVFNFGTTAPADQTVYVVIGNNDNNPATVTIKDHSKEVIRVIVDNVPGQAQPTVTWQTVHYSRDVTYDTKTGAATKYGDWQADDTPTWAAYTAKGAKGYTPSITVVPAQNVTPDTQNTVVSITYTLNSQPTSPSNPSNPTSPTSPTTPTTPVNPTSPSNPTSPTSPTNPTTPVNPTSPSNPTNPTSPTSPTNPVQPTTAPVHPENPVNPTQPNNNNNGGNNSNSGNNGNQGNGNNTSGNVAPHATVTPKNGNGGSGTNENVAPGNGNTVNNINKHGSENVAPHAQSLANINGNGTNSNNLPKSNSNGNQNQLPQTGQSTKEEAMAAAGLMIAVGDGIFVMAGTQKRRRRN